MPPARLEHTINTAARPIRLRHMFEYNAGKHYSEARWRTVECLKILVARTVDDLAELGLVAPLFRTVILRMRLQTFVHQAIGFGVVDAHIWRNDQPAGRTRAELREQHPAHLSLLVRGPALWTRTGLTQIPVARLELDGRATDLAHTG